MLKQIQERKIVELENRLLQSHAIIKELIAALDCSNSTIRDLVKDVALSYMESVNENFKNTFI